MSDLPTRLAEHFGPRRPVFDTVLRGFHRGQVTALVERVLADDPALTAEELRATEFDVVLRGYDRTQVAAYLDQAIALRDGGTAADGSPGGADAGRAGGDGAPAEEQPEFDVVMRGYDRGQVAVLVGRYLAGDAALTAEELRSPGLDVVLRGFDRSQVAAYLERAADRLQGR
ncbi:DivIVA domain-containing protein [Nocardiopsis halophila]|uniref:DivIVA domain-containing protein n=1 Tax=Nocardiopsis halophila TaxID=141692 RepID=UPI0003491CBD|nr:DivIVA domain-containing protein [Nocardiopsis halophila]